MALIEEAHKAARLLLDHAYVRIVARAEPDAACAVALLAHALRRENVDLHVTWLPRLDEAAAHALTEENPDALVLVGLSGDAAELHAGSRRVVLDRVPATLEGEHVLDPSRSADARADLALAPLAHLVAVGASRRNADLAPLALAGALAAHGPPGRLQGLDAEILSDALDHEVLLREPALGLHGATLLQAIVQLDAPYVPGLTGRARNAKKLVQDLGLSADAPPSAVKGQDAERLGSYLALRLLEADAPDAALDALFRPALRALKGPLTGHEAGALARRAEAACAAGRPGLAFAAAWPDAAASAEVDEVLSAFRDESVAALLRAERERRLDGPLVVADAPRATACAPFADRLAVSLVPSGRVALARHAGDARVALALRACGHEGHVGRALRHAAAAAGGLAAGTRTEGRALVDPAEETRFRKALAEGLS